MDAPTRPEVLPTTKRPRVRRRSSLGTKEMKAFIISDVLQGGYTTIFIVVVFFILSIVYYKIVEGWEVLDCVYFIVFTVSTVGYGTLYPTSESSQAFTIFLILFGVLVIFATLSAFLNTGISRLNVLLTRSGTKKLIKTNVLFRRRLYVSLLWLLLCALFGALIVMGLEDWSYITALYFVTQTMSTVGYGDLTVGRGTKIFLCFYIFISTALLGYAVNNVNTVVQNQKVLNDRKELLKLQKKLDFLADMNEGRGVNKHEFVLTILEATGRIEFDKDIQPWMKKFKELDTNESGILDQHQLAHFSEQNKEECEREIARLERSEAKENIVSLSALTEGVNQILGGTMTDDRNAGWSPRSPSMGNGADAGSRSRSSSLFRSMSLSRNMDDDQSEDDEGDRAPVGRGRAITMSLGLFTNEDLFDSSNRDDSPEDTRHIPRDGIAAHQDEDGGGEERDVFDVESGRAASRQSQQIPVGRWMTGRSASNVSDSNGAASPIVQLRMLMGLGGSPGRSYQRHQDDDEVDNIQLTVQRQEEADRQRAAQRASWALNRGRSSALRKLSAATNFSDDESSGGSDDNKSDVESGPLSQPPHPNTPLTLPPKPQGKNPPHKPRVQRPEAHPPLHPSSSSAPASSILSALISAESSRPPFGKFSGEKPPGRVNRSVSFEPKDDDHAGIASVDDESEKGLLSTNRPFSLSHPISDSSSPATQLSLGQPRSGGNEPHTALHHQHHHLSSDALSTPESRSQRSEGSNVTISPLHERLGADIEEAEDDESSDDRKT